MKPKIHALSRFTSQPRFPRIPGAGRIVAAVVLACAGTSQALVWTGPGGLTNEPVAGTWDTTTANLWTATTGAGNAAWAAGPADFGGAGGPITVTLSEAIPNVSNLNFLSPGYTLAAAGGVRDLTTSGNVNVVSSATAIVGNNVNVQKTAGSLSIGTANTAGGTLTINSGGTVKTTAGGNGTATYLQGIGTVVNVNGTLARTSNSVASTAGSGDATHIGNHASDNVTVNVNTGGTYSTGGRTVRIGSTGTAVMNIDGGAFSVLSATSNGHVYLGYNAASNATVNVTAGSFSTNPGNPGAGAGQLILGLNATSRAALDVSGGTVTAFGRMVVGVSSTNATAILSETGTIIAGNTGLMMAELAGSVSTFHLDGGTLTTSAIAKGAGESTFNLNGGIIKASADSAAFVNGLTRANVRDGGAIFDTNGKNVTVNQSLLHSNIVDDPAIDGGLAKNGSGVLVLTGFNSYTGQTTVNAGTLTIENVDLTDHAGTAIAAGATLKAMGDITTAGTLSSLGKVDLTDAAANTLTVGGTVAMTGSSINIELLTGSADRISATGAASISGVNTVNLSLAAGQTLTSGSYTLLSAAGGLNASAFTIGTRPPGFNQLTLSTPTPNELILTVAVSGNPTPSTAYWSGLASSTGSPANPTNLWGYGSELAVAKSNWSTTADGFSDPLQVPGGTTNAVFTASNATHVAGVLSTRLDAAYPLNGLTIDVPGATGITSTTIDTNAFPLTISNGGVTLAATSGSSAGINGSGSVVIATSQSWSNNSDTRSLGVTSAISAVEGVHNLTLNGTGTGGLNLGSISDGSGGINLISSHAGLTTFAGNLTYTGSTQFAQGKILFNDIATWTGTSGITLSSGLADALTFHQSVNSLVLPNVPIEGTGGIVKTGAGSLTLSNGASYYDKGTVIDGGTLFVNTSPGSATGSGQPSTVGLMDPGNVVTVNNGGTLAINGTAPLGNSEFLSEDTVSVVVNAGGIVSGRTFVAFLRNLSLNGGTVDVGNGNTTGGFNTNLGLVGTVVVGGSAPSTISTSGTGGNANVSLGSNATNAAAGVNFQVANVTADAAVDLTISSILRNHKAVASGLIKSGPGSMRLSAANTYTGSTTVAAGELILGTDSLANGSDLVIGAFALLKLDHGAVDTVNTLTIAGVQMASGTYGPGGISNPHITGTGSLFETTGPVSGYDTWSLVIPNVDDRGREDDPDGDGFNNLSEYLFGTSPIENNGSLVQTTASGSSLVVRWSQRNVGTFILQESSTLLDNPWPASGVPVGNANDQSGLYSTDYTRKEATVPINSARKFVRVSATE